MRILAARLGVPQKYRNVKAIVEGRKNMAEKMLVLRNGLLSHIDENWDETKFDANTVVHVPWEEFKNGWTISGPYSFPSSDLIENKAAREKYQEEVDAAMAKVAQAERQREAKMVVERQEKHWPVTPFFVDLYSLAPRADAELVDLLKKYEYPEVERNKIFKALNIPIDGFREWQSKDGLFKTTAKFVSLDKGDAILEKPDGKRTSIELSTLREDRDYVKTQLTMKPEDRKGDAQPLN